MWQLLRKACESNIILEFHVDDSDMLIKISQDWPLKGTTFVYKNPAVKTRLIFGQDENIYFPTLLKTIAGPLKENFPKAIKQKFLD